MLHKICVARRHVMRRETAREIRKGVVKTRDSPGALACRSRKSALQAVVALTLA